MAAEAHPHCCCARSSTARSSIYCEYYFANSHRDISYRIDLPPAEPAPFFPRCINAPTLATLVDCDAGYSATHWQKQSFPGGFTQDRGPFRRDRQELYHPGPHRDGLATRSIPPGRASSRSSLAAWSRSEGSTFS